MLTFFVSIEMCRTPTWVKPPAKQLFLVEPNAPQIDKKAGSPTVSFTKGLNHSQCNNPFQASLVLDDHWIQRHTKSKLPSTRIRINNSTKRSKNKKVHKTNPLANIGEIASQLKGQCSGTKTLHDSEHIWNMMVDTRNQDHYGYPTARVVIHWPITGITKNVRTLATGWRMQWLLSAGIDSYHLSHPHSQITSFMFVVAIKVFYYHSDFNARARFLDKMSFITNSVIYWDWWVLPKPQLAMGVLCTDSGCKRSASWLVNFFDNRNWSKSLPWCIRKSSSFM